MLKFNQGRHIVTQFFAPKKGRHVVRNMSHGYGNGIDPSSFDVLTVYLSHLPRPTSGSADRLDNHLAFTQKLYEVGKAVRGTARMPPLRLQSQLPSAPVTPYERLPTSKYPSSVLFASPPQRSRQALSQNHPKLHRLGTQTTAVLRDQLSHALVNETIQMLSTVWLQPHQHASFAASNHLPSLTEERMLEGIPHSRNSSSTTDIPQEHTNLPSTTHFSGRIGRKSRSPISIAGFVCELLRRSRVSAWSLQVALCYIEAVRPQVTHLLSGTIPTSTTAALGRKESPQLNPLSMTVPSGTNGCAPKNALKIENAVEDSVEGGLSVPSVRGRSSVLSCETGASASYLTAKQPECRPSPQRSSISTDDNRSPLLCPRRTLLAALVLASKFVQDGCYSNRAWATLSGLSVAEVGCCERALGTALDWRLWVGQRHFDFCARPHPTRSLPVVTLPSADCLVSGVQC